MIRSAQEEPTLTSNPDEVPEWEGSVLGRWVMESRDLQHLGLHDTKLCSRPIAWMGGKAGGLREAFQQFRPTLLQPQGVWPLDLRGPTGEISHGCAELLLPLRALRGASRGKFVGLTGNIKAIREPTLHWSCSFSIVDELPNDRVPQSDE